MKNAVLEGKAGWRPVSSSGIRWPLASQRKISILLPCVVRIIALDHDPQQLSIMPCLNLNNGHSHTRGRLLANGPLIPFSPVGLQARANSKPSLVSRLQLTRHRYRYPASAKHTAPASIIVYAGPETALTTLVRKSSGPTQSTRILALQKTSAFVKTITIRFIPPPSKNFMLKVWNDFCIIK